MKYYKLSYIIFIISCTINHNPEKNIDINLGSGGQDIKDNSGGFYENLCKDGDERPCHVMIGNNSGINSCFIGVEKCYNNKWSNCTK